VKEIGRQCKYNGKREVRGETRAAGKIKAKKGKRSLNIGPVLQERKNIVFGEKKVGGKSDF
jgi:hypothetical protein